MISNGKQFPLRLKSNADNAERTRLSQVQRTMHTVQVQFTVVFATRHCISTVHSGLCVTADGGTLLYYIQFFTIMCSAVVAL